QPVLDADVALHDPEHRVHDDHRGDDQIEHAVGVSAARDLTHPVAYGLAAAVDRLLARRHERALDLGDQRGVGKPEAVADRRAVERGVRLPRDAAHRLPPFLRLSSAKPRSVARLTASSTVEREERPPSTRLLKPITRLLPPNSTRSMSRSSPASKR